MRTFLYIATSRRSAAEDGVRIAGGNGRYYSHDQLLLIIRARDVTQTAESLHVTIISTLKRSEMGRPSIHHTTHIPEYSAIGCPNKRCEYFFLLLKEKERGDEKKFPNWKERWKYKISVPQKRSGK